MDSMGDWLMAVRESGTIQERRKADAREGEPRARRSGGVEQAAAALVPDPGAPDRPAHEWRGLMLDSARTCWGVEVVHELLELMARYRLNRLHWHLTDDSGWRFEVPGRPRLTSVGAHLPRPDYSWYGNILPEKREAADERAAEVRFDGSYGAEDIAAVVEHARELGIEVMPEVDLPGHMAAAIRAHPELGDPRLADVDPADWPHANDLLWPGEESFDFVAEVLEVVMDLFPFSLVHIGGDECKHWLWESDPELVRRYGDGPEVARGGLVGHARCRAARGGAARRSRLRPQRARCPPAGDVHRSCARRARQEGAPPGRLGRAAGESHLRRGGDPRLARCGRGPARRPQRA